MIGVARENVSGLREGLDAFDKINQMRRIQTFAPKERTDRAALGASRRPFKILPLYSAVNLRRVDLDDTSTSGSLAGENIRDSTSHASLALLGYTCNSERASVSPTLARRVPPRTPERTVTPMREKKYTSSCDLSPVESTTFTPKNGMRSARFWIAFRGLSPRSTKIWWAAREAHAWAVKR